jgi:hypothetical protein
MQADDDEYKETWRKVLEFEEGPLPKAKPEWRFRRRMMRMVDRPVRVGGRTWVLRNRGELFKLEEVEQTTACPEARRRWWRSRS